MTDGLILLGFLAVIVAFFTVRARRRLGLSVSGKTWTTAIVAFALIVLTIWAASQ